MTASTETAEQTTVSTGCCEPTLAPRIDTDTAQRLSADLTTLAHPIRLQILDMLAQSVLFPVFVTWRSTNIVAYRTLRYFAPTGSTTCYRVTMFVNDAVTRIVNSTQSDGHVCVCDLESALPVKQPTVSHHLKLLREAGLIDCERRGLWAYYFVRREAMGALRQRVSAQLEALG